MLKVEHITLLTNHHECQQDAESLSGVPLTKKKHVPNTT